MDSFPEARVIRDMHPKDIDVIRRKLTYFLCGWLGGPRLYAEHYGGISIPGFHPPLPIGESERDALLLFMEHAIAKQPYDYPFNDYLLSQLPYRNTFFSGSCVSFLFFLCFPLFLKKQKTAYEMRISDWSSDVCSSDLRHRRNPPQADVLSVRLARGSKAVCRALRRHQHSWFSPAAADWRI